VEYTLKRGNGSIDSTARLHESYSMQLFADCRSGSYWVGNHRKSTLLPRYV